MVFARGRLTALGDRVPFGQMRDRWLQRIEAVVERQQPVPSKGNRHCLLGFRQGAGMSGLRSGLQILDGCPLTPLRHCLGVDPKLPAQLCERSLRSLYYCSNGVRGPCAPVTYLPHSASFHSNERIAPSNLGIKHIAGLAGRCRRTRLWKNCSGKVLYKKPRRHRAHVLPPQALPPPRHPLRPTWHHHLASCVPTLIDPTRPANRIDQRPSVASALLLSLLDRSRSEP
jgi:hypothetical protein